MVEPLRIQGKWDWNEERQEYIGVVYKDLIYGTEVLTVGCERTEAAIEEWLAGAVKAFENGEEEPPDMYDRGEKPMPGEADA